MTVNTDGFGQYMGRGMFFCFILVQFSPIQLFLRKNNLSDEHWERLLRFDIGDWVGVEGPMMRTRKGELSIAGEELTLLSKALRPMPEKWSGVKDVELRYRQRYLDLIVNEDPRRVFQARAALTKSIRDFLVFKDGKYKVGLTFAERASLTFAKEFPR